MKMKTTRLAMALLIMGSQLGSNAVFAAAAADRLEKLKQLMC